MWIIVLTANGKQVNVWWYEDNDVCLVLNKHGMFYF